jgi:hypothetical protein
LALFIASIILAIYGLSIQAQDDTAPETPVEETAPAIDERLGAVEASAAQPVSQLILPGFCLLAS